MVRQFTNDWNIEPLLELFQLIKSKENVETVASELVTYLKCLLEPTKLKVFFNILYRMYFLKKIIEQRLIWIECLLAVLERFLPDNVANRVLIRKARNLRQLQNRHEIILGFNCLQNTSENIKLLEKYIETSADKSIVEVIGFGNLLELPLKTSSVTLMRAQIQRNLPEAVLKTLTLIIFYNNYSLIV